MDEMLPPPSPVEQAQRLETERTTRRTFLMNVGIALNTVVALAIAVPVVGFVLGPVIRRREYLRWIAIGNTADFTPGETKLVSFHNPFADPVGWTDRGPSCVCAMYVSGPIHGFCDQLRTSWLSGAVVL